MHAAILEVARAGRLLRDWRGCVREAQPFARILCALLRGERSGYGAGPAADRAGVVGIIVRTAGERPDGEGVGRGSANELPSVARLGAHRLQLPTWASKIKHRHLRRPAGLPDRRVEASATDIDEVFARRRGREGGGRREIQRRPRDVARRDARRHTRGVDDGLQEQRGHARARVHLGGLHRKLSRVVQWLQPPRDAGYVGVEGFRHVVRRLRCGGRLVHGDRCQHRRCEAGGQYGVLHHRLRCRGHDRWRDAHHDRDCHATRGLARRGRLIGRVVYPRLQLVGARHRHRPLVRGRL
mmetsp:Transcript_116075/g.335245  ORF Transcript_116075/g.335245 Transcript_116075/m.335245 type:complete len:297 (+) Transcript_116075:245-1135(+)